MRKPDSPPPVNNSSPPMDHAATSAESKPKLNKLRRGGDNDYTDDEEDEDCDMEVFDALSNSFKEAQAALDENRSLINKVKENHQLMIPENLTENVSLISEINRNISKVISIYSDLSVNFSNLMQDRRRRRSNGNSVERTGS